MFGQKCKKRFLSYKDCKKSRGHFGFHYCSRKRKHRGRCVCVCGEQNWTGYKVSKSDSALFD